MEKQGYRKMVAHNTFVGVLVEGGLFGFVLYFMFWAIIFRRVLLLRKADRFYWLGLLACCLPIFLSGSMEYQKVSWFLGGVFLVRTAAANRALEKKKVIASPILRQMALRQSRPRPS